MTCNNDHSMQMVRHDAGRGWETTFSFGEATWNSIPYGTLSQSLQGFLNINLSTFFFVIHITL